MVLVEVFGWVLTALATVVALGMMVLGERWYRIERSAYAGDRLPGWVKAGIVVLVALYAVAVYGFVTAEARSWAAWVLVAFVGLGWAVKSVVLLFSETRREKVDAMKDWSWFWVGAARLVLAGVLAWLTWQVA